MDNKNELVYSGNTGIGVPVLAANTVTFQIGSTPPEILKLCENGDIYVKGKLVENDKEVVDAMREFLSAQGYLNREHI